MIGLLILATVGYAAFSKSNEPSMSNDWKAKLKSQISADKKTLHKEKDLPADYRSGLKESIAINQYRIDHDVKPTGTLWNFMADTDSLTTLVTLFTIIVGSISVAGEFTWGTIKLLLIRSAVRSKILLSKYLATLGFALSMLILLFTVSLISGLIFYGAKGFTTSPLLSYSNGSVVEQNMVAHVFKLYGLKCIGLLMMVTFAFMISTVFRSSSLAIGLSVFLTFTGNTIVNVLSVNNIQWGKYFLFANMDLSPYLNYGNPFFKGMTLSFSITMLAVYFVIFTAISWIVFNKRDITTTE
ncbi:ABC-2 type transport system permease protein [Marininema mesophilum]|uniref:ABC-2 type transport system permease protein n=2 Tax=Marininema mesophilum TaxID=1048340 RepID=A0A1H2VPT2_9BACL|nr:ABC-2 type transport system permease protein [Marininema mesophilum]